MREQRGRPPAAVNPWTRAGCRWLQAEAALREQGRWVVGQHLRDLAQLAEDRAAVEERLQALRADDPEVARRRQRPGLGPVTARSKRGQPPTFSKQPPGARRKPTLG